MELVPKNDYCPQGFAGSDCYSYYNYSRDAKKYVTNSVVIFGELALFLGNGGMYQKHRIFLMKDKHEEKFITLS